MLGTMAGSELAKTQPFQEAGRGLAKLNPYSLRTGQTLKEIPNVLSRGAQKVQDFVGDQVTKLPGAEYLETAQPGIRKGLSNVAGTVGKGFEALQSGVGSVMKAIPGYEAFSKWSPTKSLQDLNKRYLTSPVNIMSTPGWRNY